MAELGRFTPLSAVDVAPILNSNGADCRTCKLNPNGVYFRSDLGTRCKERGTRTPYIERDHSSRMSIREIPDFADCIEP